MFHASLLPSLSVYGSWTTMKDVCSWAAVDDDLWVKFAEQLGDASLQNISLVAAVQPTDIKEAVEAAITGVVARTKLRLVYAAASQAQVWSGPCGCWVATAGSASRACVLGRMEEEEHPV